MVRAIGTLLTSVGTAALLLATAELATGRDVSDIPRHVQAALRGGDMQTITLCGGQCHDACGGGCDQSACPGGGTKGATCGWVSQQQGQTAGKTCLMGGTPDQLCKAQGPNSGTIMAKICNCNPKSVTVPCSADPFGAYQTCGPYPQQCNYEPECIE